MPKTFYIRTYGCQMNERDSEALAQMLIDRGMRQTIDEEEADILLFNTCSVRDQAERKVFGKVGILKKLKHRRPEIIIGVIGCMAQNHGREIMTTLPHVDLVVGTDRLHILPEIIQDVTLGNRGQVYVEPGTEGLGQLSGHEDGKVSAFVSVMRGCNQFCSYCIVPYVRGREKSRPIPEIITEGRQLVAGGTREIYLLGQNVTAYGLAEARPQNPAVPEISPFADLLTAINEVPGVERIRFTSPHPRFMNERFIDAVTGLPKVCESFHIPLQSGSNRILKAMRRGYSVSDYIQRVEAIRQRLKEVVFSTDVIVGFPGETEEDFMATREVMNRVGFEMAYIFKYSPRTGTKAAEQADDVAKEIKEERNQILLADLKQRTAKANDRYLGEVVEILVEGQSKRNAETWMGRSRTGKVCIFRPQAATRPGQLKMMRVDRVTPSSLFGELH
ncbi:MAG: tRNA (N6-isopentenyl adenosine(37)-C2)-methylthiotransferase MiaB [Lentisphaeria bacterium]